MIEIADHKVAEGHWDTAKFIIEAAYREIPNKSVVDSFNYYRFHYELQYKCYKDSKRAFAYTDSVKRLIERHHAEKTLASRYALIYYWRGDLFFAGREYKEAYEEYYKGREIGKKVLDECGLGDFNYRLGFVVYQQGKFAEAKSHFLKCYNSYSTCNRDFSYLYRIQEVLDNIGLCYYNSGAFDSAAHYYHRALSYIEENLPDSTEHQ